MAISYKLMQNTNEDSAYNGQFYAKAVHTDEINLDAIAERIQRNCSMKKSDCLAVLTELVEVMKDELQASHIVRIDGLGTFKVGIRGKYAESIAKFNPNVNIVGYKVNFRPSYTTIKTGTSVDAKGAVHIKKAAVADLTKDITVQPY